MKSKFTRDHKNIIECIKNYSRINTKVHLAEKVKMDIDIVSEHLDMLEMVGTIRFIDDTTNRSIFVSKWRVKELYGEILRKT